MHAEERESLIGPKEAAQILGVCERRVGQLTCRREEEQLAQLRGDFRLLRPALRLTRMTLYRRADVLALASVRAEQAKSNHRFRTAGVPEPLATDLAQKEADAKVHRLLVKKRLSAVDRMRMEIAEAHARRERRAQEDAEDLALIERRAIEIAAFS